MTSDARRRTSETEVINLKSGNVRFSISNIKKEIGMNRKEFIKGVDAVAKWLKQLGK